MQALKIPPGAVVGTWRYSPKAKEKSEGAQIDLLFDCDDGTITICDMKYNSHPFKMDKPCYQNLMKKIEVFKRERRIKKQIFISLITNNGLEKTIYSEEIVSNYTTLDDLFE